MARLARWLLPSASQSDRVEILTSYSVAHTLSTAAGDTGNGFNFEYEDLTTGSAGRFFDIRKRDLTAACYAAFGLD
jgi:hypothetical protein